MNLFQQLLQDTIGTKRGQAVEAKVQPTLSALAPISQELVALATQRDPQLGTIIQNGEAVAAALNNLVSGMHAPEPLPTGPTEEDVVLIVNNALTSMGLPTTDDATFDIAVQSAYNEWKSTRPTG